MGGFFNETEKSHRAKEGKEIIKKDILKEFFAIRILQAMQQAIHEVYFEHF